MHISDNYLATSDTCVTGKLKMVTSKLEKFTVSCRGRGSEVKRDPFHVVLYVDVLRSSLGSNLGFLFLLHL